MSSTINSLRTALNNKGLVWPGYILLVCLLSAVCFGSLKDHLLDVHDYETFQDNVAIGEDFTFFFSPEKQQPTGRPTADLVKFLAYLIGGNDPAFFHLLVVALHALATILLALLAWELGSSLRLSLTGGLLFLLNVTHFQAVHHISALDYPLALALGLGTLLCFLRFLATRKWQWLCSFYGGFVISVMALAAMAFLWPFCLYWCWSRGYELKKTLRPLLPLLGLTTVELAFIVAITPGETNAGRAIGLYSENAPIDLLGGMGKLFLWSLNRLLTTAHWVPYPLYEFQSWELYGGAGVLAVLLLLIFWRRFPGSLWSTWVLLSLLPFLPLYPATAGFSLLLAWSIEGVTRRPRFCRPYLYASILAGIFASSYYFLKQVEALSFYSSGRYYIARGDFEKGIEQLSRAVTQGKGTVNLEDTYVRLCYLSFAEGGNEEIFKEALAALPESPTLNIYKVAFDSVYPDSIFSVPAKETLNEFKSDLLPKSIEVGPNVRLRINDSKTLKATRVGIAGLFHNLGNGYMDRTQFDQAISAYRQSLDLDSKRVETWQNLVGALVKAELNTEAVEAANRAVELNPHAASSGLFLNASLALAASGEIGEAIDMSRRALGKNPTPNLTTGIFRLYRDILENNPGAASSEDCSRIGFELQKGGNLDDSITAFRLAIEKDETNSRAHFGLGLALLSKGQFEEAERIYSDGVAKFGRAAAMKVGAPEGIRDLISKGIQVAHAQNILDTYWPGE